MFWLDRLAAGLLAPLAVWVLASGLDDLFLDLCAIYFRSASPLYKSVPACATGTDVPRTSKGPLPEKTIALLVPAWREAAVIEQMLDYNVATIQYSNYEIFVGVYPNDIPTRARVLASEKTHSRVHHVLCPHNGPTSKADCLNWLYLGMQSYEQEHKCHFEIVAHHDAEDVVDPHSLQNINESCETYDMVQIPVLPLATPWWEATHGAYCDDFAQSHLRELHVRQRLGGFLPSCGVGTAYRRTVLDRLAWNQNGVLFQTASLAEDYRIGLDLHRLGCSQILLHARDPERKELRATREYFPRTFGQAVRQRARWIMGIALQSWQEIGWNVEAHQIYWLWRDRKGLLGNPLTVLTNLLFLYGAVDWLWARATAKSWILGQLVSASPCLRWIIIINMALMLIRLGARASCVKAGYGWKHALISPIRSIWGNLINFCATAYALLRFTAAWLRRQSPQWAKTEHSYPAQAAAVPRRLGEVLVHLRLLGPSQVDAALQHLQPGERLGEHLVRTRALSEFALYTALALQKNMPFGPIDPPLRTDDVRQALPPQLAQELKVVPVRMVRKKQLWVAGSEPPTPEMLERISSISHMETRFHLVTPSNYRDLYERFEYGA